jgi:S1-C subfamily serine protease
MSRVLNWLGLFGLLASLVAAQESRPLTNDDVISLVKAGIGSAVVAAKIAGSPCHFDTSPVALQQLKAAGVPDDIVVVMLQASGSPPPPSHGRIKDEMTSQFQHLQNAVLTVWSETGHGTGFIADQTGLILTNHHVVGPSDYIAVQFDKKRKIPAVHLESDPLRDVAVLWADVSAFPEAIVAPLASSSPGVEEGERVFTIGSPLSQRKILTSGVASKLEARAILSDININFGNSGGPLFNSLGEVVGITTFRESVGGAGISGIVRIEEALPLIERARADTEGRRPPPGQWLPVEPEEPFPVETLRAAAQVEKLDLKPYVFGAGDYDIGILTPVFLYRTDPGRREAVKSKEKRTKQSDESFDPSANLYNWREYAGAYLAVVQVRANPKLRETFWSAFGRGLAAASGNYYIGPANMKYKTDFLRMDLLCGQRVIAPIQPARIAKLIDISNPYIKATDATYDGLYTYPIEAFSPECGTVTLKVFSERKPAEPTTKVLEQKTVDRVWADFGVWRLRTGHDTIPRPPDAPSAEALTRFQTIERREPTPNATPVGSPHQTSSPDVRSQSPPAPRVSNAPSGRLRVLTDPVGAAVYVGDLRAGATTPEGLLIELPAGSIAISVRKAGYSPVERTLIVGPNEDVVLPLTLHPGPEH